jgi:hypothetical protein
MFINMGFHYYTYLHKFEQNPAFVFRKFELLWKRLARNDRLKSFQFSHLFLFFSPTLRLLMGLNRLKMVLPEYGRLCSTAMTKVVLNPSHNGFEIILSYLCFI